MLSTGNVKEFLAKHKLRNTTIRGNVLNVFFNNYAALTNQDIENQLTVDVDRVTLYRTLQKFLEHGILHQIEDGGHIFYALCSNCEVHDHHDNHIHFKCRQCETIQCIEQKEKMQFSVPKGYQIESMKILLEGICANCTSK